MVEEFSLSPEPVKESAALNLKDYEAKDINEVPDIDSPQWSDYVLSQLESDELWEGNPTTDGLRRIVKKLLGPITRSVPIVHQAPTPQNENHATVSWELEIMWEGNPTDRRVFGDVADVYSGNTNKEYAVFAAATAATRAEGRALRKALQLRHVLAAEEQTIVPPEDPSKINKSQIEFVNMMCKRNNINVLKLIDMKNYKKIDDVPYTIAVKMSKYLSDCQNGKEKIPSTIKGYDENWRQINES